MIYENDKELQVCNNIEGSTACQCASTFDLSASTKLTKNLIITKVQEIMRQEIDIIDGDSWDRVQEKLDKLKELAPICQWEVDLEIGKSYIPCINKFTENIPTKNWRVCPYCGRQVVSS